MTKGDKERYRVEAAIAAMNGIYSDITVLREQLVGQNGTVGEAIARSAVLSADALMKELGLDEE